MVEAVGPENLGKGLQGRATRPDASFPPCGEPRSVVHHDTQPLHPGHLASTTRPRNAQRRAQDARHQRVPMQFRRTWSRAAGESRSGSTGCPPVADNTSPGMELHRAPLHRISVDRVRASSRNGLAPGADRISSEKRQHLHPVESGGELARAGTHARRSSPVSGPAPGPGTLSLARACSPARRAPCERRCPARAGAPPSGPRR